jgi:hypothetical protein
LKSVVGDSSVFGSPAVAVDREIVGRDMVGDGMCGDACMARRDCWADISLLFGDEEKNCVNRLPFD